MKKAGGIIILSVGIGLWPALIFASFQFIPGIFGIMSGMAHGVCFVCSSILGIYLIAPSRATSSPFSDFPGQPERLFSSSGGEGRVLFSEAGKKGKAAGGAERSGGVSGDRSAPDAQGKG